MLRSSLNVGRYVDNGSALSRIKGEIKICLLLILIIFLFVSNTNIEIIIMFVSCLVLMFLSKVNFNKYLLIVWKMKWFLFFIGLINLLFKVPYDVVIIMCLRIVICILFSNIFLFSTRTNDVEYGLKGLLSPLRAFGFPVDEVVLAIVLTISFIQKMFINFDKIIVASMSRGISIYSNNIREKVYALVSALVPMFILSIRSADVISDAMELRFYSGGSVVNDYKYEGVDFVSILFVVIIILLVIIF